jgi:hypothetical protein
VVGLGAEGLVGDDCFVGSDEVDEEVEEAEGVDDLDDDDDSDASFAVAAADKDGC